MDELPVDRQRRFRFGLRSLFVAVAAASIVSGFVYQELRIRRLSQELSRSSESDPVLLFHLPRGSAEPCIAGYVGGQFIEMSDQLELRSRRQRLKIAAEESGLSVSTGDTTIQCQTLRFDPISGKLELDDACFFERLGVDLDFRTTSP